MTPVRLEPGVKHSTTEPLRSLFCLSGPIYYLPREMYLKGYIVEEIWEGYSVFCSHRLTNDNLVDIIKFIPIFISAKMKHRQIIIIMIQYVQSKRGSNGVNAGVAVFKCQGIVFLTDTPPYLAEEHFYLQAY